MNYTQAELEAGEGRYADRWTVIFQRHDEDAFATGSADDLPGKGYHVAGGCSATGDIKWCDLR